MKKNNIEWLDTLRAVATLGVIIIHVSSPVVNTLYGKNMEFWWIGNVMDSAVRFSVPLFLMLSGATLLGKQYGLGEFYQKRVSRVFIPFLFWMLAYWVFRWEMLQPNKQPSDVYEILQWAVNLFLKEGISKHFWYIYMIVFIYLFVPVMGNVLRKLDDSFVLYLLLVWVLLTIVCKSVPLNLYSWSGDFANKFLAYFLYSGYLVLGYYLNKFPYSLNKKRLLAATVFFSSVIFSAVSTYVFSKKALALDLTVYGYLTINTIIQSTAIFIWMKDCSFKNNHVLWVQRTISNYSYGIYLVHIIVIGVFFRNGIFWTMAYPLISLPLMLFLTLITSIVIIYGLRKIPFGKYISG